MSFIHHSCRIEYIDLREYYTLLLQKVCERNEYEKKSSQSDFDKQNRSNPGYVMQEATEER